MYTNSFIRLHSKCLAILDLIQQVNNRLEANRSDLHHFDNSGPFSNIRLFTTRREITDRVSRNKVIRERLVNWYADTMTALTFETMKRTINEPVKELA